jgi:hypothetical protein
MSLRYDLELYLAVRRKLGHDLGTTERVLRRFVDFAEAEQAQHITTALLLRRDRLRRDPEWPEAAFLDALVLPPGVVAREVDVVPMDRCQMSE